MNSGWERFYAVIRKIPRGRVATYGQIAKIAGQPRHARQVGYALNALPSGTTVPWHRVINAAGKISGRADPGWVLMQLRMLEAEGIEFGPGDRVSLDRFGWIPFPSHTHPRKSMGKGDRKSRKGKIWRGSYGNRRLRKKKKKVSAAAAAAAAAAR